ncbi:UNKNOWN [Stylonychia lemnae]|uniref:Conserved oligomeric Golgi complex subunit 5 helical domain-containing protein n=1 Tax=Stylonychia lemnae TaxID=5949 RepID=A0A078ALG1_STYLE|nr:UNKNOWN [Stylonychia lemnae]|eukprot:CDW82711.1 UNKNOWN [Stylonychia lemnae]
MSDQGSVGLQQWRSQLQQDKKLSVLLRDNFDEASFLYDLYKTYTITEINQFKWDLEDAQRHIEASMKAMLCQNPQEFNFICEDLIKVQESLEKIEPVVQRLQSIKERQSNLYFNKPLSIEKNMINQIQKAKSEVQRFSNILTTEIMLKDIQQIFQLVQRIGYSYDFNEKKILDPLGLSVTLKSSDISNDLQELSKGKKEQQETSIYQIPEVKVQLDLIQTIKTELIEQTQKKFQESYENRDIQGITQTIQIFFNLETLSDQIQGRVNQTLKSFFTVWKVQIQSLNERVQGVSSKDEENTMVDKSVGIYINDMIKHTLKVYTLSLALSERDPASAYESIQDSLEKVKYFKKQFDQTGLNNIFNLYWDKLVYILKQSLTKIEQTEMYSYLFQVLSNRYFIFLNGIMLFWQKILNEITPSDKIQILELKFNLFDSLSVLKNKYLQNISKSLLSQEDQILRILDDLKKFGRFVNSSSSGSLSQTTNSSENNAVGILYSKINEMTDTLSIHINTTQTQLEIKSSIIQFANERLTSIIQHFSNQIIAIDFDSDEQINQLKFNFLILDVVKLLENFLDIDTDLKKIIIKQIKKLRKLIFSQLYDQLKQEINFTLLKLIRALPLDKISSDESQLIQCTRKIPRVSILQTQNDY